MKPFIDSKVEDIFSNYPDPIHDRLLFLRSLIFEVYDSLESVEHMEETLKWGELVTYLNMVVPYELTGRKQNQLNTLCISIASQP